MSESKEEVQRAVEDILMRLACTGLKRIELTTVNIATTYTQNFVVEPGDEVTLRWIDNGETLELRLTREARP